MKFNKNWQKYSLYDLAKWKNGIAFKSTIFSDNTGYPVIKIAELKNGITSQTNYTKKEFPKDVYLKYDDLIFSWSGNPETSIDAFLYRLPDGYLNQHSFKVTANSIINKYFLYYILKYLKPLFKSIARNKQTTGLGHITISDLKEIKVGVPSLNIQNLIINILQAIDKKIELNNQINNNLYKIGNTNFENWLCSCNKEVTIRDIADEILDYHKNTNDKVKLINSSDITENHFPTFEFVTNKHLKGHFKKRFKKNDILYSQIRPKNHHFGYVQFEDFEDYIASTRLMVIRNKKERISSSLLYFYLTSKGAIRDFTTKTESRSGTFPQGNFEDLSSYKVKYSTNQDKITKLLDIILYKIYENENQNNTLEQIRDTLLPNLMNGDIDLSKIDI